MKCSLIICSRNRARSLENTLHRVLEQQYGPGLEIVLVDNGSTDDTQAVIEAFTENSPHPVKSILEPELGLSHARNTGVRIASGDIVVFIDDDAYPCNCDWIEKLAEPYSRDEVAAAGGDILPVWPGEGQPDWLHTSLLPCLGIMVDRQAITAPVSYPNYPWGANVSFRKNLLERYGGFRPDLGRKGDVPLAGEETELCMRLQNRGFEIVRVARAPVFHVLRAEELTVEYLMRIAPYQGISDRVVETLYSSRLRILLKQAKRVFLLLTHIAGWAWFSIFVNQRNKIRCEFLTRSLWAYLVKLK